VIPKYFKSATFSKKIFCAGMRKFIVYNVAYEIVKAVKMFPLLLSNFLYSINEISVFRAGMQCAVQTRGRLNLYFFKWHAATGMPCALNDSLPVLEMSQLIPVA
jgi:hypothetical protein